MDSNCSIGMEYLEWDLADIFHHVFHLVHLQNARQEKLLGISSEINIKCVK